MIVKENLEISGKEFVKQYSDGGFYIERDGGKYSEAIDPANIERTYTETDEPIETNEMELDSDKELYNKYKVEKI